MAKSDGTIVIDTKIDTSNFSKSIKNLNKDIDQSISEIGNSGKKAGEEFAKAFDEGAGNPLDDALQLPSTDPLEKQEKNIREKLDSLSGSLTRFGTKMSVAVTAPLTLLGSKMVTAASDMEENINKVNVAFGESAEEVKAWSETATASFGLSKNQALEATSLFGDMATSMGLSQEEAANMSTSLAGLAGDMASFKNVDISQAMNALNGVFTGETESLKSLGIVMTEVNLKQFADDLGIVYSEMTQAEKVQLRYAYVMEMTKNAQGDYANTADGTANSMRTMEASIDNLSAALGQHLLPAITPIIQGITDLITKFGEMDPASQKIIIVIGAVLAAIGPLATAIGGVLSVVNLLMPVISSLAGAFNPVTLAIGVAVAAIALLIANWDAVQEKMQLFDEFLKNVFAMDFTEIFGPVLGEVFNAFVSNVENVYNSLKEIFSGIIDFITGVFTGDWEKAWNGVKDIFSGIFNLLASIVKAPINAIIGAINGLVGGVVAGINLVIRSLNSLSFTVPDWVPAVGGKSIGFSISEITAPKIPYLASGAVIPPNAPFMAVLGDQKRGNNIEAPEALIRKIVREESGKTKKHEGNIIVPVYVDGNKLLEILLDKAKLMQASTGTNVLTELG